MPTRAKLTSIEFRNFKALGHFSIKLQRMNVLVGPNNAGKSTVLSALRVLAEGMRRARARSAQTVTGPQGDTFGYPIPEDSLPISIENVHTDYEEEDTRITFRTSNGSGLELYFPRSGGCFLLTDVGGRQTRTPSEFRYAFPFSIGVVPVLGPVEHEEELLSLDTVRRGLATHRASRHFRNYWHHYPDGFERFAEMVKESWPGMTIEAPHRLDSWSPKLTMFAEEDRIPRELYWAGFGFQVWCQLLTHLSRSADDSLIVVDEPEVYLHPDVQRQLLSILRAGEPDVVLATHSTEIISEADPSEILLVDKARRSAQRLRDVTGIQAALEAIGSIQNITLTRLARSARILFVEGDEDERLLRRFASRIGLQALASGNQLTAIPSGGFSTWERIKATAWGLDKTLGKTLAIAAVFDRDYHPPEEIQEILAELRQKISCVHIHERKEIENYLLDPAVLQRVLERLVADRNQRSQQVHDQEISIRELLDLITAPLVHVTQSQYAARRNQYLRHSGRDEADIMTETSQWFERMWRVLETRLYIVPGKEVLRRLRDEVQQRYGVSLTSSRIIEEFRRNEVPDELRTLLEELNRFGSSDS